MVNLSLTGDAFRADGYYGYTDGNHTISIHFQNYTGRFYMEASLVTDPAETDWFPISLTTSTEYLHLSEETSVQGYTFQGNFVWLRARMDRSYISPVPDTSEEIASLGSVTKVYLNL